MLFSYHYRNQDFRCGGVQIFLKMRFLFVSAIGENFKNFSQSSQIKKNV
jgi:hypothetical protein